MTTIHIKNKGKEKTFEAKKWYSLLAQIEEQWFSPKYWCRAGNCKLCACKITKGKEFLQGLRHNIDTTTDTILICDVWIKDHEQKWEIEIELP